VSANGAAGLGECEGFTLVEMFVSLAVLALIMVILFSLLDQTSKVVNNSSGKIETFESARNAFETMTRTIKMATLNSYYDYIYTNPNSASRAPTTTTPSYQITSDLHFISGDPQTLGLVASIPTQGSSAPSAVLNTQAIFFQAPLGYSQNASYQYLDNLLNACGFFLQYGPDVPPGTGLFAASNTRYRYQLMQFIQPAESLSVYSTSMTNNPLSWFNSFFSVSTNIHAIADNVIALILLPQNPNGTTGNALTSNYVYDSRSTSNTAMDNVLPPVVLVTMIAIDEGSARKMGNNTTQPAEISTALQNKFTNTANFQTDLQNLQTSLNSATPPVNYRVFQTQVALRSAKFTY